MRARRMRSPLKRISLDSLHMPGQDGTRMTRYRAYRLLIGVAALTVPSRAHAQKAQDSTQIRVDLSLSKAHALERVLAAFTSEGAVVTQASDAGSVIGQYVDGSMIVSLFATVFTTSSDSASVSLAASVVTRATALGTPQLSDFVSSGSPRQGKAAWERLHRIAIAVAEP